LQATWQARHPMHLVMSMSVALIGVAAVGFGVMPFFL